MIDIWMIYPHMARQCCSILCCFSQLDNVISALMTSK